MQNQNPFIDYRLPDKIFVSQTPNEKILRSKVFSPAFIRYLQSIAGHFTTNELAGMFQTYTHKYFPIDNTDENLFANFVINTIRSKNVPRRPVHQLSSNRTRDPRFINVLPTPILDDNTLLYEEVPFRLR